MIKMSKMHKRVAAAHGAMLALSVLPAGSALAQATPAAQATELQTVTVTAQRRTENIKEVPVSVSAIKGEKLDVLVSGGGDIRLLAGKVPSLNIESSNGRTFPRFYIRGYGNTDFSLFASQPVSLIYDDIVQENPILKGYPIYDVSSVEVLRGPQGTLFGRNTPAGVVKFESEKPNLKKVEGYYNVSYGTHGTSSVEGAANVPLSDKWAMRVSTLRQHRDDYIDNYSDVARTNKTGELDGYNEHNERVQFLYTPDSTFSALFNVHQRTTSGSARLFRANLIQKGTNDFAPGTDLNSLVSNALNFQDLKTNGANMRLSWDLGAVKLYSITGYEGVGRYHSRGDIDGGVPGQAGILFPVQTASVLNDLKQYTQEFRVESKNAGPLNWQAGVYYFNEDVSGGSDNYNDAQALTSHLVSQQKNKAWAAFGSATYVVSDDFTVRGGIRYTKDEKDFQTLVHDNVTLIGPGGASTSKDKFNWDLSGTYKLNRDVNAYVRVATGFRAPSIAAPSAAVPVTVADAETITSYEAGIKSELFERRARVNFSIYDYEVKNQQLTVVGGTSNDNKLINADKTKGRGAELDFEGIISPSLRVTGGASYNYTRIDDPSLYAGACAQCTITDPLTANGTLASINGNSLPQAPKWTVNATARYGIPMGDGEFFVFTDWSYRTKVNFFLYESTEFTGKPLTEGGLRVGYNWAGGKYEVAAFGRNILDQRRITGGIDFNNLVGFTNEPRMWGVQFKGNF